MNEFIQTLDNTCLEAVVVGKQIIDSFGGDMNGDLQFMCRLFSERQLSQLQSIICLKGKDDIILIARSMFEGALYLAYSIKNREMCRRWRMYSVVIDLQRIKEGGDEVPECVKKELDALKPEADRLFKNSKGDYQKYWYGSKAIRLIAQETDKNFLCLYDTYYKPMSEYHHWGTAAFGKRYKLESDKIVEIRSDEVKLEQANALCMALSSMFSTLKISSAALKSDAIGRIIELEEKLRNINGVTTREMKITSESE